MCRRSTLSLQKKNHAMTSLLFPKQKPGFCFFLSLQLKTRWGRAGVNAVRYVMRFALASSHMAQSATPSVQKRSLPIYYSTDLSDLLCLSTKKGGEKNSTWFLKGLPALNSRKKALHLNMSRQLVAFWMKVAVKLVWLHDLGGKLWCFQTYAVFCLQSWIYSSL